MENLSYHIVTLGCDKNSVDSEGIGQILADQGFRAASGIRDAKVIVVNTCGFIDIAREESLDALRAAARSKSRGQLLVAAGCLAQREGDSLKKRVPGIDGVVGTQELLQITGLLARLGVCTIPTSDQASKDETGDEWLHRRRKADSATAFIKIGEGCNSSCRFCAIPAIKGPYRSKPADRVIDEARQLAELGVQEIVLVAQDTAAYGWDLGRPLSLSKLVSRILDAVPELPWLRLLYTYPQRIDDDLLQVMADSNQICHYLDLPLQHGDPGVLERMGRPSDVDRAKEVIRRAREAMPDLAIRTTFIVGYPGETEAEFQNLLRFMKEVEFDHVGAFTYSPESGTAAAGLPGRLPEQVKRRRLEQVMETQRRISLRKNQAVVGKTVDVLIEGIGEMDGRRRGSKEPISVGRARRHAPEVDGLVFVRGRTQANRLVPVRITGATEYDLWGKAA